MFMSYIQASHPQVADPYEMAVKINKGHAWSGGRSRSNSNG